MRSDARSSVPLGPDPRGILPRVGATAYENVLSLLLLYVLSLLLLVVVVVVVVVSLALSLS